MLQGPFKLTVTASINPLFVESQPGGNKPRGGGAGTLAFGSLLSPLSLTLGMTWQKKPGLVEEIQRRFRRSASSSWLCCTFPGSSKEPP